MGDAELEQGIPKDSCVVPAGEPRRVIEALQSASTPFAVELVSSLEESVEALKEDSYDVALVELSLPDGEGTEIVDRFRQEAPALPIILLAADPTGPAYLWQAGYVFIYLAAVLSLFSMVQYFRNAWSYLVAETTPQ